MRAVTPMSLRMFGSAPLFSRVSTVAVCPFRAAPISAVAPMLERASTEAPAARRSSTTEVRPAAAASISAVQPFPSLALTLAPAATIARVVARSPAPAAFMRLLDLEAPHPDSHATNTTRTRADTRTRDDSWFGALPLQFESMATMARPPNEVVEKPGGNWQTAPAETVGAWMTSDGQFSPGEQRAAVSRLHSSIYAALACAIFSMLWTSVNSCHCVLTLRRPRSVNRRRPLF